MQLKVHQDCVKTYQDMKFRRQELRFIIYKVGQGEEICIDATGFKDHNWTDLMHHLPATEPRYAVFDVEYTNKDNMKVSKLIFVYWTPEGTSMKSKMLYAQGKENFKTLLSAGKELVVDNKDYTLENVIASL